MYRAAIVLTLIISIFRVGNAAPDPVTARKKEALSFIEFPWQELNYEIVFLPARVGFRAMTFRKTHTIEVYLRPQDDTRLVAYDIAHELGHAIDLTYNTQDSRERWMKSRGIDPATPWFGCNECSDFSTPAGDFAETFALLLLGPDYFAGRLAPRPTADQTSALRAFFPKDFLRQN
jgi:hypothetical protein